MLGLNRRADQCHRLERLCIGGLMRAGPFRGFFWGAIFFNSRHSGRVRNRRAHCCGDCVILSMVAARYSSKNA